MYVSFHRYFHLEFGLALYTAALAVQLCGIYANIRIICETISIFNRISQQPKRRRLSAKSATTNDARSDRTPHTGPRLDHMQQMITTIEDTFRKYMDQYHTACSTSNVDTTAIPQPSQTSPGTSALIDEYINGNDIYAVIILSNKHLRWIPKPDAKF